MAQKTNGILRVGKPRERTTAVPRGYVPRTREAAIRAAKDAVPNGGAATTTVRKSVQDLWKGLSMIRGTDEDGNPITTLEQFEHLNITY